MATNPAGRAPDLRDSGFQSLLQLGPRVFGVSREGTVYELDDSLREITGHWSLSSGPRWSAMGAERERHRARRRRPGGQLRLWSVADHTPIGPASVAHPGGVNASRCAATAERVVSLGATRQPVEDLDGHTSRPAAVGTFTLAPRGTSVGFLSDDRTIAVGEWNGAVQLFDADALTLRSDFGLNGTVQLHDRAGGAGHPDPCPNTTVGSRPSGIDGWVARVKAIFGFQPASNRPSHARWRLRSIRTRMG